MREMNEISVPLKDWARQIAREAAREAVRQHVLHCPLLDRVASLEDETTTNTRQLAKLTGLVTAGGFIGGLIANLVFG